MAQICILISLLSLSPQDGKIVSEWLQEAASARPDLSDAARQNLEDLSLDSIPHLVPHLRDPVFRRTAAEVIEAICRRSVARLARVGPDAISDTERSSLEKGFRMAGPASASSLAWILARETGAQKDAAARILEDLLVTPPGSEEDWNRLEMTLPLSVPLLTVLGDSDRARQILREAAAVEVERLGEPDWRVRQDAARLILALGETAEPSLREAMTRGDPHLLFQARRLLRQIHWRMSPELVRRTGGRLEGFEERDWRGRREVIFRMERLGQAEAIPTLRRILDVEESIAVRVAAAESLGRLGDLSGLSVLQIAGIPERHRTPQVTMEIYHEQGIRYLRKDRYEEAIGEFLKVLEVDPENETAFYNLACAHSLLGNKDSAFEALESAIRLGFDDFQHMEEDEDLDPIRDDARYGEILRKHGQR